MAPHALRLLDGGSEAQQPSRAVRQLLVGHGNPFAFCGPVDREKCCQQRRVPVTEVVRLEGDATRGLAADAVQHVLEGRQGARQQPVPGKADL